MLQLKKLILIEIRTYIKNSLTVFFSFLFPIFLMVIIMITTGNPEISNEYKLINKYVIISLIVGLVPLALLSFSISVAAEYEFGIIERLKLFGIEEKKILKAKVLVNLLVITCQFVLIIGMAIFFRFEFPPVEKCTVFILCYLLAALSLFFIAWIIARILKKINRVQVVGMSFMFIILALSGAFGEFGKFPVGLERLCFFIPTYDLSSELTRYCLGENINVLIIIFKQISYNFLLIILMGLLSIKTRQSKILR